MKFSPKKGVITSTGSNDDDGKGNLLQSEIYIEIENGVPYCKRCKADDCSDVGFAIGVEQFYGHRRGSRREETVEDIILDN